MIFLAFLLICLTLIAWLIYDHQSYFRKRNVKYLKSIPFLGCLSDAVIGRKSIYENILDIYNTPKFKDEPFFGIFMFHKPALIIKDSELIKRILITDFNSFGSRHASSDIHDPLGYYSLFFARYEDWQKIRGRLSGFFSTAKLRSFYYLINKLGYDLNQYVWKRLEKDGSVELNTKKVMNYFFVDVISNVAFGVEAHSLENSGSEFHVAADSIFKYTFYRGLELTANFFIPELMKTFNFKNMSQFTTDFIYKACKEILEEREKSGAKRFDLIDTLIELKNELKPTIEGHTTEDMLYAQIAIFLAAGYETSSITSSFTLYELSRNREIQNKLRAEIKQMLERNEGRITYESVSNISVMPYLHQVVNETLRVYSTLPEIDRVCTNPEGYSLAPFSDFKIPFGMPVFIPIYGLGKDEKYFADPLKYDPDRFAPENIDKIPSCVHIPFGIGQRFCLGERLGWIQTKTALCNILKDFRVEMSENTPISIKLKKNALLIQSQGPLMLRFVKDPLIVEQEY